MLCDFSAHLKCSPLTLAPVSSHSHAMVSPSSQFCVILSRLHWISAGFHSRLFLYSCHCQLNELFRGWGVMEDGIEGFFFQLGGLPLVVAGPQPASSLGYCDHLILHSDLLFCNPPAALRYSVIRHSLSLGFSLSVLALCPSVALLASSLLVNTYCKVSWHTWWS